MEYQAMKPEDSPEFDMALAHLEEQWPEKLEDLLKRQALKKYLVNLVQKQWEAEYLLEQRNQGMTALEARELTLKDRIAPDNPKYDAMRPKALSKKGQELLEKFRASL